MDRDLAAGLEVGDGALLQHFILEAQSSLSDVEFHLLTLGLGGNDWEGLDAIKTHIHKIKGSASLFALDDIERVSHEFETLLARCDGRNVSRKVLDEFSQATTLLEALLAQVELSLTIPQVLHSSEEAQGFVNAVQGLGDSAKENSRSSVQNPLSAQVMMGPQRAPVEKGLVKAPQTLLHKLQRNLQVLEQFQDLIQESQSILRELNRVSGKELLDSIQNWLHIQGEKEGKALHLTLEGADVDLSRGHFEVLHSTLIQLARNALAHGIEDPHERRRLGKESKGSIHICLEKKGQWIQLHFLDDGRGICRQEVIQEAQKRGLFEGRAQANDGEIASLLFKAGFTTAKSCNPLTGRGMGLHVVKNTVESAGGNITLKSQKGKKTLFTLSLPWHQG